MRVQTFVELAQVLEVSRQALWRYRKLNGSPRPSRRGHDVEAWRAWIRAYRPPEPTIEELADMIAADHPAAEREQVRARIIREYRQFLSDLPGIAEKVNRELEEALAGGSL